MNQLINAGIVTYNPDIARLEQNISAILPQVDKVIVVDNHSDNLKNIISLCNEFNVKVICNTSNKGIAYALNEIMEYAYKNGYEWCVTLDQDSVCSRNLIKEAKKLLPRKDIAEIAPLIYEAKTGDTPTLDAKLNGKEYQKVPKCITASTITNVSIWKKIGGFDNKLFIDYVDYDYSLKARKNGYIIVRMNNVRLNQELGDSEFHRTIFGKIRVANHSAFRKYYICRNIVIFIKRYHQDISVTKEVLRIAKTIGLTILFEDDKSNKIKACNKGIKDGIYFRIDK